MHRCFLRASYIKTTPHRVRTRIHAQHRAQIRVCQNKTCKSQGSPQILRFVQDLEMKQVEVMPCGCLGNCGNGPNVMILPQEVVVSHVGTVARMAEVLRSECGVEIDKMHISATQLRLAGNTLARQGNFREAQKKYTEAIELNVHQTAHLLLANRSGVRLQLGDMQGALEDALAAVENSPISYTTAYLRLIDVYYLQKEYPKAVEILEKLVKQNPDFKRTQDYRIISKQLLADVNAKK